MIEVPVKFGWCGPDFEIQWFDNVENCTFGQCESIADVCSNETKFVEVAKSDEEFNREQEALHQNIFSI